MTTKCYCEYQNGRGNNNGILCERNGTFQKALLCGGDQICSGPSTEEDAVSGTVGLCKQGKKYHLSILRNAFLENIEINYNRFKRSIIIFIFSPSILF